MFPFFLYHYVFSFLLIILCLKFFIKNKQKLPWSYVSAKLLYICPLSFMVKLHESNRAWKKICITNDTSPSVLSATHWYLTFPLLLHRKVSSYEHQWSSFYQILSSILCSCFIWLVRFFSKVEILLYILSSFSFHNTVMVPPVSLLLGLSSWLTLFLRWLLHLGGPRIWPWFHLLFVYTLHSWSKSISWLHEHLMGFRFPIAHFILMATLIIHLPTRYLHLDI